MFRHLTAASLIFALALPAPSQADNYDEKVGAALGILSLLAIIHLADKNRSDKVTVAPAPKVHPSPRPHTRKVLPARCVYRNHSDHGPRRLLSKRCLRNQDVNVRRLPQQCETMGRNRHGRFKGYRIRCIKRAGWSLR